VRSKGQRKDRRKSRSGSREVEQMLPTFGDNNTEQKHQTLNQDKKPASSLPLLSLFPFSVFLSTSNF